MLTEPMSVSICCQYHKQHRNAKVSVFLFGSFVQLCKHSGMKSFAHLVSLKSS